VNWHHCSFSNRVGREIASRRIALFAFAFLLTIAYRPRDDRAKIHRDNRSTRAVVARQAPRANLGDIDDIRFWASRRESTDAIFQIPFLIEAQLAPGGSQVRTHIVRRTMSCIDCCFVQ